jgi:general stress protein 26
MAKTHDHEIVSIYPFSDAEIDQLMANSNECVLMWATKDGWPVGVTHSFVWRDGKIWITFAAHRHRAAAIRRDNRVSVCVSSAGYPPNAPASLAHGAITFKGRGVIFDDAATKGWFYPALSKKLNPTNASGEEFFNNLLDSPLRVVLCVTPEKKIMYNSALAGRHMAGTVSEEQLGARLEADRVRMNKEREARGLKPR